MLNQRHQGFCLSRNDGYYQHPEFCSRYIRCEKGEPRMMKCEPCGFEREKFWDNDPSGQSGRFLGIAARVGRNRFEGDAGGGRWGIAEKAPAPPKSCGRWGCAADKNAGGTPPKAGGAYGVLTFGKKDDKISKKKTTKTTKSSSSESFENLFSKTQAGKKIPVALLFVVFVSS